MTALFGAAIASTFMGSFSDRVGRRPCMLICVGVSIFTTILKYLVRGSFWGFCAANFANGLFDGAIPVALAYASDVHPSRHKKDDEIGILIGCNMIGRSGGGIAAILLESQGLFTPLLAGAALNAVATFFLYFFMIEPNENIHFQEEVDDDDDGAPEKFNWSIFSNVNIGALLDNIGSTGIVPLSMAPLAFSTFLADFLAVGESPIMTPTVYKWIFVLVALMVIPGAVMSQSVFQRIGAAGGCVLGNSLTAVGITSCLYICRVDPPTRGTLIGFIITIYSIFPLTVLSQLSTGPMLDRLSPVDKRGFSHGLNVMIMNFANAVFPYLFGTMADNEDISPTLWTTIAISLLAAVVNFPLMFAKELKPTEKLDYQQAMGFEDQDLVNRAMEGKWVPAKFLLDLNDARMAQGLPILVLPVKAYAEERKI